MKTIFVHEQETWSEDECLKRSKSAPADYGGNKPPKGLINCVSSPYPRYGQTRRYNGGCIIQGHWYEGETVPLPKVPEGWEFVQLSSWGTRIQKCTEQNTKKENGDTVSRRRSPREKKKVTEVEQMVVSTP